MVEDTTFFPPASFGVYFRAIQSTKWYFCDGILYINIDVSGARDKHVITRKLNMLSCSLGIELAPTALCQMDRMMAV